MPNLAIQTQALTKNYGPVRALEDLNWEHLLGLLGFTLLFTLLAWLLFERRDVRLSGTGSWKHPPG
jgi:ABC-type transport system involved in multi-copper enzyme maturation permease subunit